MRPSNLSSDRVLQLYTDPEAGESKDASEWTRYVEAITGVKFKIQITLQKSFQWGNADAVRVILYIDGQRGLVKDLARHNPILFSNPLGPHVEWATNSRQDPTSKRWYTGELIFGSLTTSNIGLIDLQR